MNKKFIPIIGIEVHIELKTKSKMFCGCPANHFRVKPNTHTCPVCLALPGALPVPNKQAIEWCLLLGMALDCRPAKESKFDRKNYFYPDLPKGYQISQYDMPFARNGELKLRVKSEKLKVIRINRVHMEEDTAKLIHRRLKSANTMREEKYTLIDFNRSGVPLVEIVTEPDIQSSEEAVIYLKKIQQIIRYLGVSDCDMEKGSMRCEVNVSLKKSTSEVFEDFTSEVCKLPNYKVEIKNINSFKFVKKAIEYEIERQKKILESGKTPLQETRGFDESRGVTYLQRTKEEAHDYRYFPEPDIPAFKISNFPACRSSARAGRQFPISKKLPELPDKKIKRFVKNYGLSEYNARILTATRELADYFDEVAKLAKSGKVDVRSHSDYQHFIEKVAKLIVNKKVNIKKFTPRQLLKHLQKQKTDKVSDQDQLTEIIDRVLKQNQKAVQDYKKGKKEAMGFLIGQVMRETAGKAEAGVVKGLLIEKLN